MRFMMINLFLVCLLLFGIAYLAFGDVQTPPYPIPTTQTYIRCINELKSYSTAYASPGHEIQETGLKFVFLVK